MSQTNFKKPTKSQSKSAKTTIKAIESSAPKLTKQIPKKLNYDIKINELFVNEKKTLNFSEYVFLTPDKTNENINTSNSRKISDNYESLDEAKSVSSLKTNSSVKYKTPKKKKTDDFKAKYKTEICKYWEIEKFCKFGDSCAFAHGNTDIKQKHIWSSYKTKKCKQFYSIGCCPYGNRCQFRHNQLEYFSYSKLINLIDSSGIGRPRLSIFQSMTKDENGSSYLEEAMKIKNEEDTTDDGGRSRGCSF